MSAVGHHDPDAEDVRCALAGDVAAFGRIVERWQGRLVNLAWRFCRDRAMAEDMAQDAFVRAFRALRSFRGESAFSTWLTAIAMNSYRSSLRDRGPAMVGLEPGHARTAESSPLARLDGEQQASNVRRLVMTLPPRYRDPIVLYYFQEMNLGETARVLGIAEGTLKARLHRGKAFLKRRLDGAGLLHGAAAIDRG